jgi:hypothetical protein
MNQRPSFRSSSFPIKNGLAPLIAKGKGPKALPMVLDFTSLTAYTFDFVAEEEGGVIDFIQGVYVDNSLNPNPLTLLFHLTQQKIVIPATAQGLWPVICPDNLACDATSLSGAGVIVTLLFLNVPTAYTQWGPITVTAPALVPVRGTFTDRSGLIAVGGTSEQLAAANAVRNRIIIENPSTAAGQNIAAAEVLFINFTSAAGINNDTSLELLPGGWWDSGFGPVTTEAITVNAATTNHNYIAKEM